MSDHTIAFIGGGNMAGALIGGLLKRGRQPEDLVVVEPWAPQRDKLAAQFGLQALAEAGPALARASTVVWAVKPQSFADAAAPCRAHVADALQLSVMAGIRSDRIAQATGSDRIVRAMPNTPALIGQGIAGLCASAQVSAQERAQVEALLAPTGRTLWVAQESDLDAVTALSGSGPAYVFYLLEAMEAAAARMGLPPEQGRALAQATVAGAAALAGQSTEAPATLRAQVTSKGGTTHAAISAMEASGVGPAIVEAILAAQQRARELGDAF
ncbi:MAG: pyrroline-5-carboxylate reductase [Burkholderiaceae bacterium]|nr:pyrroline-5-carboxylate reductase [Rhodoferax sp.]MCP5285041.1 pyrroline-5-carboxylate reductase [Burkholderiaceae bacterium]